MRTRSRLLLAFLSAHILFTVLVALLSYHLVHHFLRQQAEHSARSLARVIAEGGFTFSERIQQRMSELSGYDFHLLTDEDSSPYPGSIEVPSAAGLIRINYQTAAYQSALRGVWIVTLILGSCGIGLFALIAWTLSQHLARPLERLAVEARKIGDGQWQHPIPAVGSGEVLRLAEDFEVMRQQLRELEERHRQAERLATLGTFTATIAHEVRNPLSAIRLSIQMQRQQHPEDEHLQLIEEEIERLDDIVDELLGLSKGMTVTPQSCALHEIAAAVQRLLARQARHAGVTLQCQGQYWVWADPRRLRQLLLNLVMNAIQSLHGGQGGRVLIQLCADGLRVEDDGPGIDPTLEKSIFEAFVSTHSGGSGLGLHLARLIAEAHGGRLSYQPSSMGGACFILAGLSPLDAAQ